MIMLTKLVCQEGEWRNLDYSDELVWEIYIV